MDQEMQTFCRDLLESVRQMKTGRSSRETVIALPSVVDARNRIGMSQVEFACLLGVSVRTIQDWEQGRRAPCGTARTLLKIVVANPQMVRAALVEKTSEPA